MENIYVNPVGNIKKDIYIMKNDINDKVYIGQSINSEERFKSHCKGAYDNSIIDRAIAKYGKEHFWYEILENQVENYNDREKYWIMKYNSVKPNGYNIMSGGESPPIYKGDNHPSTELSDHDVVLLKNDLANTNISYSDLAKKYKISKRQVLRINHGVSRNKLEEKYPIRKNPNTSNKLTDEDVDIIIDLLKYSYQFCGEIARQFSVDVHVVDRLNTGKTYYRKNEQYPIRKWKSCGKVDFTYEQVTEIIELLKTTDMSFRKIAKMYGGRHPQISQICYGTTKKYVRENEKYPLRKPS